MKDSLDLNRSSLIGYYQWTDRDVKTGRFLGRSKRFPLKSYTAAAIDVLMAWYFMNGYGAGAVLNGFTSFQDTANATHSLPFLNNLYEVGGLAAAGDNTFGQVVGTGAGANDITTYKLTTIVANGNGAGALNYGSQAYTNPATAGGSRSFAMSRVFTGNGVSAVVVTEIGLIITTRDATNTQRYYLVIRDLLGVAKTINAGIAATLTYTLGVTPA